MNTIFNNTNTASSLPEHDYVDLGLPSGTLWATENIKDAEGNDLYFAWGETRGYTAEQVKEGKRVFSWGNHEFGKYGSEDTINWGMKKYNKTDGLMMLEPKDDAATVNWGEEWKMPTKEQFEELKANTKYEWADICGVPGAKFISIIEGHTDKFLFFPAIGFGTLNIVAHIGSYISSWTVCLDETEIYQAWNFYCNPSYYGMSNDDRCVGFYVRPVRVQNI